MLWNERECAWADPAASLSGIDRALVEEYGIDSARVALICAQGRVSPVSLLESSFKWLARLDQLLNNSESSSFSAMPWLEAALQSYDHVVGRSSHYCGFAQIRRAMRSAPPGKNLNQLQRNLVISSVYPYCPLWARFNLADESAVPMAMPVIVESFSEFACVRFSLPAGGWHWKVFAADKFAADPIGELLKLKWVKKAAGNKALSLTTHENGAKVCFT